MTTKQKNGDAEVQALARISRTLDDLPADARGRCAEWLADRYLGRGPTVIPDLTIEVGRVRFAPDALRADDARQPGVGDGAARHDGEEERVIP